ncbi:hypothetical protein FEM48_Zijuj10G0016900 [Ziziphus jujuba var. spinosa]|uniref:Disease resistance R13L4/SHOC-2-like LRR domain-containing protein n=1 Tax=Ziziphus jujuba var. spinosa TaxID=714518 RepID=A0A978UKJ5_ZIZJJ|nr:hypothetical protein FEM48_Zijuj10G0016900 [Ziziphus jujuba var. spinosa]
MMKVRHLAVAPDVSLQRFGPISKAIHLRSLLTLPGRSFPSLSNEVVNNVILKLRCFRILSLSGCRNLEPLSDSIGELKHLRFLDLSCTSIKRLPNSVSMLCNLQTLKLSGCVELMELPEDMYHLINLRHLDISACSNLNVMPRQISDLKSLQTLSTFIVGEDNGTKIEELRELSDLHGELSLQNLQNVASATDASEARTPALRELKLGVCAKLRLEELPQKAESIHIGGNNGVESLIEAINKGQNSFLKKVHIQNCCSAITLLPECLPTKLTELEIKCCKKLEFPMQRSHKSSSIRRVTIRDSCDSLRFFPLDFVPNLISLDICNCENLESLGVSSYGDGMLRYLSAISIYGCPNFASFPKGGLHAPNLTKLRVDGGKKLKKLPEQMRNLLPFLNSLEISNCPQLESFPEGGLPSNLNKLCVRNCPKLIAQRMKFVMSPSFRVAEHDNALQAALSTGAPQVISITSLGSKSRHSIGISFM